MSRSPYNISASVLGIGVAVITNTSGFSPFATIVLLCFTPNLCCSSVTTNPNLWNTTFSSSIAWVPTIISASPLSICAKASLFCFAVIPPTRPTHFIPNCPKIFSKFIKCWLANIIVGAKIAAWYPLFTALYAEIIATMVFPDPTSPCNNLFIGLSFSISLFISSSTLSWAFVSLNGNEFITSDIWTFSSYFIPFVSLSFSPLSFRSPNCIVSNSSNTSLFLALLK